MNEKKEFNEETIETLKELGAVLLDIHKRILAEGFEVRDGKVYKQGTDILYMPPKHR
ncbi:MAG: hypothetical protein KBB86_00590 [Candidatus Pacebacteria bacterium]|nr:hypothetical protein [Candidatus Paceibacterota bacterium]